MSGIGVSQRLFPEHYPERGGDDDDEFFDLEDNDASEVNKNIPKEVLAEVEKELEEKFKDYPKGIGFCHIYWNYKKQALEQRGYTWLSPQDVANSDPHNRTIYD